MNRDFKGVWMPKSVYLSKDLSWSEKILLIEIDSLDNDPLKGCFASNKYLAEFIGVSESSMANMISKLKSKNCIYQVYFDGRNRGLRVHKNIKPDFTEDEGRVHKNMKSDFTKMLKQPSQKCEHNNTVNNTSNNTVKDMSRCDGPVDFSMTFDGFKNDIIEEEKQTPPQDAAAPPKIYPLMVEEWNKFILIKTSCPAKMDGVEGKAMKSIIAYLKTISNEKSEEGIVNAWKYILNSWDKLEAFHRNNLKLSQINSNLVTIIAQIKNNGPAKTEKPSKAASIMSDAEWIKQQFNANK